MQELEEHESEGGAKAEKVRRLQETADRATAEVAHLTEELSNLDKVKVRVDGANLRADGTADGTGPREQGLEGEAGGG